MAPSSTSWHGRPGCRAGCTSTSGCARASRPWRSDAGCATCSTRWATRGGATFAGWRTRTACTTSRRGAVVSARPSRSCCRTGRREARVPQVVQPCAGARDGAPGAGTCGRAGPGVPHVAGQLFRVDRPPDGSSGRAGRAPRERLDPDVLSPPRARGELVRRAPAPGSASLAAPPVRSLLAGRSDPVQRRRESEPVRDGGGRELRGLPRRVLRPAQSPPREPHHRPLRTVRHHAVGIAQAEIGKHTSELQSLAYLVCRLLLEKKKNT